MNGHVDPDFYAKYEFCRDDCPECQRLDAEDTRPQEEKAAEGIARAVLALRDEGIL